MAIYPCIQKQSETCAQYTRKSAPELSTMSHNPYPELDNNNPVRRNCVDKYNVQH